MEGFDENNPTETETETEECDVQKLQYSIFTTLTTAEIEEKMNEYIEEVIGDVKPIVLMPNSGLRTLLIHMKWNKSELLHRLTDENRDDFIAEANVANPLANDADQVLQGETHQNVTCAHCFKDFIQDDSVGLRYAHEYCADCYREQLDSFVQHNERLRWCPAPNCELATELIKAGYIQNCMCACGKQFCFDCGDDCHDPLPCELMSKWKEADYETVLHETWIAENCPNCSVAIVKEGGGNYVNCEICKQEFCWKCHGEWDNFNPEVHNYCLNGRGRTDDGAENGSKRRHDLVCFKFNKDSLESEELLAKKTNEIKNRIQELMDEGVSDYNAKYLMKAWEKLSESRKQLMFSHIFTYFTEQNAQKDIFEGNQNDLQLAADELSTNLQQIIETDEIGEVENCFLLIKNKTEHCTLLLNTLKEHIFEGIEQNWWTFE